MSEPDLYDDWYDYAGAFVDKKNASSLRWQALTSDEQEIAALWLLEADMYNGGFIQFFCNWGEEAYLHARQALQTIGAERALELIASGYACIARLEHDDRLTELWDIPKFLTEEEGARLDELDQRFWEDPDRLAETAYRYYAVKLEVPTP